MSTPLSSIHLTCKECIGSSHAVKNCGGDRLKNGSSIIVCPFFPYRLGHKCGKPSVKLIRSYCKTCMNGDLALVRDCPSVNCPVFSYRMGKNPKRKGIGRVGGVTKNHIGRFQPNPTDYLESSDQSAAI